MEEQQNYKYTETMRASSATVSTASSVQGNLGSIGPLQPRVERFGFMLRYAALLQLHTNLIQ